jgi:XTP/dITP diphosphohydrolase
VSSRLFACSTNPGKLREFALAASHFGGSGYVIESLPEITEIPAPDEPGLTFVENALVKAQYYSGFTSELVFADDSGLEVEALGGQPGVHSARFAGPGVSDQANNDLLLSRLSGVGNRAARFVCVIGLARTGQSLQTFRGEVNGQILLEPRGENGFGYDPLFFYPPFAKSFAEIGTDEKFRVSHRGEALRKLFEYLSKNHRFDRTLALTIRDLSI